MEHNRTLLPTIFACLSQKPERRSSYYDLCEEIKKFGFNEGGTLGPHMDNYLQQSLNKGKELGLLRLKNGMIQMLVRFREPRKALKREPKPLQEADPASLPSPLLSKSPPKKMRKIKEKSSENLFKEFIRALCKEADKSNSDIYRK